MSCSQLERWVVRLNSEAIGDRVERRGNLKLDLPERQARIARTIEDVL